MKIIGLTGGSGSGKSKVAQYLHSKYNAYIIDADVIGHQVILNGKNAYDRIIEYFGDSILNENQQIDRQKLGFIVFSDQNKLKVLNSIIHPQIELEIKKIIEKKFREQNPPFLIVIDGALLIETGIYKLADEVWITYADMDVRVERLRKRDKLSKEMIQKRISSQMSWNQMKKYGDRIINNSSSFQETMLQCDRIMKQFYHL